MYKTSYIIVYVKTCYNIVSQSELAIDAVAMPVFRILADKTYHGGYGRPEA